MSALNGGWGIEQQLLDHHQQLFAGWLVATGPVVCRMSLKAATAVAAPLAADSSVIGGKHRRSCSASKFRATGRPSRWRTIARSPVSRTPIRPPSTGSAFFTGQVGYAIHNVLLYMKCGGAVTSNRYFGSVAPGVAAFDTATNQRWGGTVGAGFEYGFAPNWTAALEYDHLFMGTSNVNLYRPGLGVTSAACRAPTISARTSIWSPSA